MMLAALLALMGCVLVIPTLIGRDKSKALEPAVVTAPDPYRHDADHWCVPFIPHEALGMKLRWLWGWQIIRRRLGGHWELWTPAFLNVGSIWVRVAEPTSKANIEINRARTGMYCGIFISAREYWP